MNEWTRTVVPEPEETIAVANPTGCEVTNIHTHFVEHQRQPSSSMSPARCYGNWNAAVAAAKSAMLNIIFLLYYYSYYSAVFGARNPAPRPTSADDAISTAAGQRNRRASDVEGPLSGRKDELMTWRYCAAIC